MKKCNIKGCNNTTKDNNKYCEFHKQEVIEKEIKGVGAAGAALALGKVIYKNKDKIIEVGKTVGKFAMKVIKK